MRADFDQEKKRAVNVATRSLERDLERLKADHATELVSLLLNFSSSSQTLQQNKLECYTTLTFSGESRSP